MRRVIVKFAGGLAGGIALGYALRRTAEAVAELREPAKRSEPNAKSYGALRRGLMLSGIARSLLGLGTIAYGIGPLIEPKPGERESRARRMALIGGALAVSALVDLPADFVEGFALERRYGLSKQTARDWALEHAKSAGLTVAIGVPLIELLALAIARAPRRWPLVATLGSVPLLVLANVVAPTYIAPLFNTFEALEGEFAEEIRALASRFGAGDAKILRVDMSKQTEKANAYVTGLFATKRIVIGDTLLGKFEPRETMFVVAHELGHYATSDVWRMVGAGTGAAAFVFFGGRAIATRGNPELASTAGLARLFFAISLLSTIAGPVLAAFSRSRERAADEFAIAATSDATAGAAAFRRLRDQNLAEDEQPRWMELLFSSHPSLRKRIANLEAISAPS
jgi:Zn-dependent protease with chaperone function